MLNNDIEKREDYIYFRPGNKIFIGNTSETNNDFINMKIRFPNDSGSHTFSIHKAYELTNSNVKVDDLSDECVMYIIKQTQLELLRISCAISDFMIQVYWLTIE